MKPKSPFRTPLLNDCYECKPGLHWLGEPRFELMDRSNGGWLDQDGVYIGDAELETAIRCGDVTLYVGEPEHPSTAALRALVDALEDPTADSSVLGGVVSRVKHLLRSTA